MRNLLYLLLIMSLLLSCKDTATDPETGPDLSHIQALLSRVSIDSMMHTVRDLSGESMAMIGGQPTHLYSRKTGTTGNRMAAQYLLERLSAYGLPAVYHRTDASKPNVIATRQGMTDPTKRIVICAHFDNSAQSDTIPGADDNASGTAAVIEAARLLSEYRSDATIIFALFNEEEQGLVGSSEYANQYKASDHTNTFVINMDMIAWDGGDDHMLEIHAYNVAESPQLADTLVYLNNAVGIGLNPIIVNPGSGSSDHRSFWENGRSAIMMIEGPRSVDFNPYYHSPNDLIIHFNAAFYEKCARLGIGGVAMLAKVSSTS